LRDLPSHPEARSRRELDDDPVLQAMLDPMLTSDP
jgi:hypothetical protein